MDQQRVGFLSDFVWSHLLTGYFLFEIETQDLFLMRCNYNNSIIPRQAASSCFCSSGLGNSRINSIAWVFSTNERKCCVFVRVSVCVCVCACQYHLRETIADINVPFWYVIFRKGGFLLIKPTFKPAFTDFLLAEIQPTQMAIWIICFKL